MVICVKYTQQYDMIATMGFSIWDLDHISLSCSRAISERFSPILIILPVRCIYIYILYIYYIIYMDIYIIYIWIYIYIIYIYIYGYIYNIYIYIYILSFTIIYPDDPNLGRANQAIPRQAIHLHHRQGAWRIQPSAMALLPSPR